MNSAASSVCKKLTSHKDTLHKTSVGELFASGENRFEKFSLGLGDILFDYSKNHIDDEAMKLLFELTGYAGLEEARAALFAGQHINLTEDRAVMHMALRNRSGKPMFVDGENVMGEVLDVLQCMRNFTDSIRAGRLTGKGGIFTDVVNIGIGGSDLGPVMVSEALRPYQDGPNLHYVSNIDGADLQDTLKTLNPATTLFIVASKSFTTQETMTNARSARKWLVEALGELAVERHFAAISTNLAATVKFGIGKEQTFGFWSWVGGRYSIWSAIGLSVMIGIGWEHFESFLQGAHDVDLHFQSAPIAENVPVIMALIGIWHRNICNYPTQAILPYAQHLHRFPAYLQQLDMESNGKGTCRNGLPANCETGPVVWGEPGTNGQHAFYQLIHQGTDIIPVDFLLAVNPHSGQDEHHEILVANCLAQSEALMVGKTLDEAISELVDAGMAEEKATRLAPHKVFSGNRPSSTFLFPKLTPYILGQLIALYEHKIFVQGIIWDINSFDQWGVELGKQLANSLLPLVQGDSSSESKDASTSGLLEFYHANKACRS